MRACVIGIATLAVAPLRAQDAPGGPRIAQASPATPVLTYALHELPSSAIRPQERERACADIGDGLDMRLTAAQLAEVSLAEIAMRQRTQLRARTADGATVEWHCELRLESDDPAYRFRWITTAARTGDERAAGCDADRRALLGRPLVLAAWVEQGVSRTLRRQCWIRAVEIVMPPPESEPM